MKKKLIICALTCVLLTGCGSKIPKLSNGDEAIIEFGNGDKISANEIWDEVKVSYGLQTILKNMDLKIYEEEYKDKKEDVEAYIKSLEASLMANYMDEDGNFDENALNQALAYSGYSGMDQYLEEQTVAYYENEAATDYAKNQITDKEIKTYYDDEVVGDIDALHILVKPASSSSADTDEAKKKAEDIIKAIQKDVKSGTKVKEAFEKYKDNEEVVFEELGYFNKGKMEEPFEEAAYKLKVNAYSKTPVKTSYGYHIILKLDQKEKEALDDVKEDIIETLANELLEEDTTIPTKAAIELREKHGVEFHDSELEKAYQQYLNYQLNK